MLEYSAEASEIKEIFYHFYNELDIYVEDEDDEVFYETLLTKVLSQQIRASRVFGVGGKDSLFEKLDAYLAKPSARKKFFIADGDLDWVLGRSFRRTKHLHVLREYCIENFLFEVSAIYSVMQEEVPRRSLWELRSSFNPSNWLEACVNDLTPLFACFIIVQKYSLGKRNVKLGVGPFLSGKGIPQLDKTKIAKHIDEIRKVYVPVNGKTFDDEMREVMEKMGKTWKQRKRHICGKSYLMPLLRFEVKRHTRREIKHDSFRFRIVKNCELSSLAGLRKKVEALAKAS